MLPVRIHSVSLGLGQIRPLSTMRDFNATQWDLEALKRMPYGFLAQ